MTDREEFEAWWGVKYVSQSLEEDEAWAVWQAALAQRTEPQQQVEPVANLHDNKTAVTEPHPMLSATG